MNTKKHGFNTSVILATAAVLLAVMFVACRKRSPSAGVWGPCSYWTASEHAGKQPVQGIGKGSVAGGVWYDEPNVPMPLFVVWVGEEGGGSISSDTSAVDPATKTRLTMFTGSLARVPFECRTTDGKPETIKVGGESYRLAQGPVLLVSKSGPKLQVKQLPLAVLHPNPDGTLPFKDMDHVYFKNLASTNTNVRAFWNAGTTTQ